MTTPKRDEISLKKLQTLAAKFVDGTPEGDQALYEVYPKHLYDKLRVEIAVELAGKEIAKILDAENDDQLSQHRAAVAAMYDGRQGVYAPVHDFWSLVEMVLHVKKKELPELITAQNVTWTREELPLEELHITSMPFIERHQEIFGPKPWKIADLQRIFFQKPELFEQAVADQRETVGEQQHNFDQSAEPIAIVYRNKQFQLIDGNGRLYRALLAGKDTISCYIGRQEGVMPINYWISAGTLKQFCMEVRGYADVDLEGFANGLSYLRTKLRNNTPALINYTLFLRGDFPEFQDSLQGIVPAVETSS
jgi:hypothetical protein